MHFRISTVAPIEPQNVSFTKDGQYELVPRHCDESCRITIGSLITGRSFNLSRIVALGIATLAFTMASTSSSADQLKDLAEKAGIKVLADGDSSSNAEDLARHGIPLKAMTQESRQRALVIIKDRSQFRKLPSLQYTVDETMFRYLLRHPDVAVSTWRVMGISRFEMWQTGEQEFEAHAIDGSEGIADILYQDDNQMVFICQGSYHNPLLPRAMEASALIWFRTVYTPGKDGSHIVTQKTDVFVRFPSSGVSALAKVLTPVLHSLMDRNLFEVSLYGSMMSRAVRDEPEWVVQVAQQMEGVLPQRKAEWIDVARKPRGLSDKGPLSKSSIQAADRSMILSPQLLFLDPPDDVVTTAPTGALILSDDKSPAVAALSGTASQAGISRTPGRTASSTTPGNLMLITTPVKTSTPVRSVSSSNARTKRSDDGFILQPVVVPPAGSTATDPAGSESPGTAK